MAYLIPPAPHSVGGTTKGVRFTVNNNDTNGAISGLNIYPNNRSFTGNFALKFDLWINYPGGAGGINSTGSTQHAIFGINHLGTQPNWAATSASSTDGIWFGVDGEGGTSRDYRAYVGNLAGVQAELIGFGAGGPEESNNTAAIYQTLFPSSRFESAGAPGKNWVAGEVRQVHGVITWKLDDTVIAQRTNVSSFTAGDVMLGYMDTFTSIAHPGTDAFVIFENVRVENLNPPVLRLDSILILTNGQVQMNIAGALSNNYFIEASDNLTNWQPVTVSVDSIDPFSFVDPEAPNYSRRFYRARQ